MNKISLYTIAGLSLLLSVAVIVSASAIGISKQRKRDLEAAKLQLEQERVNLSRVEAESILLSDMLAEYQEKTAKNHSEFIAMQERLRIYEESNTDVGNWLNSPIPSGLEWVLQGTCNTKTDSQTDSSDIIGYITGALRSVAHYSPAKN